MNKMLCGLAVALCIAGSTYAGDCCGKGGAAVGNALNSGVEGTALRTPVFGTPPPRPIQSVPVAEVELIVKNKVTGKEVARTKTDKNGNFKLDLPAGDYKIEGKYGRHWDYRAEFTVKVNERLKLKFVRFRYNGPPVPAPARGN